MKYKNILYSAMAGILLLASCAQTHENAEQVDHLPNMYPDYADVTIPVNIAPLNFEIRDKNLTNIETTLTIEGADANDAANTLTATSNSQNLKFDMDDWKAFLQKAVGKNIKVQIYSKSNEGEWTAFKPFTWQVVGDSLDAYLTYRLIEPDYEVWNKIQIKQRCIENWQEKILADHNLQENRCMNCHAFGNQDSNLSMVYIRGEGGGAILNRNGKLRKLREAIGKDMGMKTFIASKLTPLIRNHFPLNPLVFVGDPSWTRKNDTDDNSTMKELKKHFVTGMPGMGHAVKSAATNDPIARINASPTLA